MSETRVTPEMVEAAAIRVMCGAPRHDAWHVETGLGTPQERWADTPETDREHWRENARAVLAAADAVRPATTDDFAHVKAGDPAPAGLKGGRPVSIGFSIPFMCSREFGHVGGHIFAASGVVAYVSGATP